MKLLHSSLLLVYLWALSCWDVLSATLIVIQSADLSVMEREATNITCCWTGTFSRLTVNWLKNRTDVKSEIFILSDKCRGSVGNDRCRCSTLTFSKIRRQHSGTYVCRVTVEIPVYSVAEGNGTAITVIASEDPGDSSDVDTGEKTDDTTCKTTVGGRGRSLIIPETVETADDITHETTDGGLSVGGISDGQEDIIIHIMRCLPVLALFITFFYLYNSASKSRPRAPAPPENSSASEPRTEENQEDEEKAGKPENEKEDETNATSTD